LNLAECRKPFRINESIERCKKTNLSEPNCAQTNPSQRRRGTAEVRLDEQGRYHAEWEAEFRRVRAEWRGTQDDMFLGLFCSLISRMRRASLLSHARE
jgi:hypothetical protein